LPSTLKCRALVIAIPSSFTSTIRCSLPR
jgi:hypothetical protein